MRVHGRRCVALVLALAPALAAGVAAADHDRRLGQAAVEIEGVEFPSLRSVEGTPLRLHKVGLLRWLFFNGYAAGLYLGDGARPAAVLSDAPKRLEICYFRAVPAAAFGEAAQKILARNVDVATLASVQQRVDQMAALYRDVEPGDRYALTYLPGAGTRLEYNGVQLGVIRGADFASAYFAIWLGDDPIDASLREQLLAP